MPFPQRAAAQTYQSVVTIDLSGHRGMGGASLEVEIEFTKTPDVPMRWPSLNSPGEPAEGGEVEIVAVRPFQYVRRRSSDPLHGNVKTYLDCPAWLDAMIRECIDTDLLTGDD